MSLDVTLIENITDKLSKWEKRKSDSLKEAGEMKGIIPLIEEYYNDRKPKEGVDLYEANITHNLGRMASEAGIYTYLWRPDELNITLAKELIEPLKEGLKKLKDKPEHFKNFNPSNGWGNYENLVSFVENYLNACIENPEAIIHISR